MIVCSVSVYCVSGAIGLFLIFYLDQFLIVLEYVLISFLVYVCIFFSFCWFSICLCLCSWFLDFCMLHCCQGIVSMGGPVFWIGCLGIHRCNGCACLLMRVLACISSEGSCTASVSTSWKRQGIFVGHSIWYILERARVHSMCACVCVCVLLCVDLLYRWVCVFQVFEVLLGYVVLFSILLWLDAWCACASVEMQFFQIAWLRLHWWLRVWALL